jgi:hypothetical protein
VHSRVEMDKKALELSPDGRSFRLRESYWNGTCATVRDEKPIAGGGEDTITGHARDFAALHAASEPFIQSDELIVGGCLAVPQDGSDLDLGRYDPHFPPGHQTILSIGLAGIGDDARRRLARESDSDKWELLTAVAISPTMPPATTSCAQ